MDDKTWELLLARFDKIEKDLVEIRAENKLQTKMIGSLKVTVAGISSTVSIIVMYFKTKFFGG
jgi:hypothetical protein